MGPASFFTLGLFVNCLRTTEKERERKREREITGDMWLETGLPRWLDDDDERIYPSIFFSRLIRMISIIYVKMCMCV